MILIIIFTISFSQTNDPKLHFTTFSNKTPKNPDPSLLTDRGASEAPQSIKSDGPAQPRSVKSDGPAQPRSVKSDGPAQPRSVKSDGPVHPRSVKSDGPALFNSIVYIVYYSIQ
jgi:hypothetical protein